MPTATSAGGLGIGPVPPDELLDAAAAGRRAAPQSVASRLRDAAPRSRGMRASVSRRMVSACAMSRSVTAPSRAALAGDHVVAALDVGVLLRARRALLLEGADADVVRRHLGQQAHQHVVVVGDRRRAAPRRPTRCRGGTCPRRRAPRRRRSRAPGRRRCCRGPRSPDSRSARSGRSRRRRSGSAGRGVPMAMPRRACASSTRTPAACSDGLLRYARSTSSSRIGSPSVSHQALDRLGAAADLALVGDRPRRRERRRGSLVVGTDHEAAGPEHAHDRREHAADEAVHARRVPRRSRRTTASRATTLSRASDVLMPHRSATPP